jgi:acyl-CoA thioesterase-1
MGDSISDGYGVSAAAAYPQKLETIIREHGYKYKVVSASISGSTTASGPSRMRWFLKQKPDLLILALGANDGLRGLKLEQSQKNLSESIQLAKVQGVKVILAGMMLPPNYGLEYTTNFRKMFQDLAKEHELPLIPFLLEGVGGVAELNLADGIHPNEKGHQKIAEYVFQSIQKELVLEKPKAAGG